MPTKCQFCTEISLSKSSAPANSAPLVWIVVLWKKAAAGLLGMSPAPPLPNPALWQGITLPPTISAPTWTLSFCCRDSPAAGKTTGVLTQGKFLISQWVYTVPPGYLRGWGWSFKFESFLNKGLTLFRIIQWRRLGASIMNNQGNISKRRRRTQNSSKQQG